MQYDAFEIGFITIDDFGNADVLEATYPAVAKRLHGDWIRDPAIPVVTGFLGKVSHQKTIYSVMEQLIYLSQLPSLALAPAGLEIRSCYYFRPRW